MAKRWKISRRVSKRMFSRTGDHIHKMNFLNPVNMRGGISI